jgi:hypothetical protein
MRAGSGRSGARRCVVRANHHATDGPFLEAKEALGGFYVLEAQSIGEGTDLARNVPRSPGLVAEILPIIDM